MSGTDFELFLTSLFAKLGYKTEHVGHTGDFGVDVVVEREGKRIAIQSKRYGPKNKAGEDAVREALAGIKMYNCSSAIVVTNSFYTPMAKKLARANSIELWDRNKLAESIMLSKRTN
jgi:restriction system protein